jgi:phage-related protein
LGGIASWLGKIGQGAGLVGRTFGYLVKPLAFVFKYLGRLVGAFGKMGRIMGLIVAVLDGKLSPAFQWLISLGGKIAAPFVAAFGFMLDGAKLVFNWVKGNWPLLLAILTGPIGLAALVVVKNFDRIKAVASSVWDWIKGNWPLLLGIITGPVGLATVLVIQNFEKIRSFAASVIDSIVKFFAELPGKIGDALSSLVQVVGDVFSAAGKAAANLFIDAVNFLIGKLNTFKVTVPDWVPIIGGNEWGFNIGELAKLQHGTDFWKGGLALVGEQGPEIVALPRGSAVQPMAVPALPAAAAASNERPVIAQVFLERRMIAEALASYSADRVAAR